MAENSCAKSASSRQGGTSLVKDADIIREFLVESGENLDRLDRELVILEQSPGDREILASIFRTIHTIKGSRGFLGFKNLEKVAHLGENLLSRLRDGKIQVRPEITSALLKMVDAIREMLANIEATGAEGERDHEELIERLSRLQTKSSVTEAEKTTPPQAPAKRELTGQLAAPAHDRSVGNRQLRSLPEDKCDPIGTLLLSLYLVAPYCQCTGNAKKTGTT
jgi:chemotaxis protein histidine kinase CheA